MIKYQNNRTQKAKVANLYVSFELSKVSTCIEKVAKRVKSYKLVNYYVMPGNMERWQA